MRYLALNCAVAALACIVVTDSQAADAQLVPVYADEEWYMGRSEGEEIYTGRLVGRLTLLAPGARTALHFALERQGDQIPIYAPGPAPALESLVDKKVVIRGKLVNLAGEGLGEELWVGAIATAQE